MSYLLSVRYCVASWGGCGGGGHQHANRHGVCPVGEAARYGAGHSWGAGARGGQVGAGSCGRPRAAAPVVGWGGGGGRQQQPGVARGGAGERRRQW